MKLSLINNGDSDENVDLEFDNYDDDGDGEEKDGHDDDHGPGGKKVGNNSCFF